MQVKRLHEDAVLPQKGTPQSAGFDLSSVENVSLYPGERKLIQTGWAIAVPEGTYGRVAPRSGLALKFGIDVMAGVIDKDYRGPLGVILVNLSQDIFKIKVGDRIAQLILEKIEDCLSVEEVETLDQTVRGQGGFGSTGGF
jgi:deoxyuridine 5'-triphosphate nucleotidohydrolase